MALQIFHQTIIAFALSGASFHIVVLRLYGKRIGKITAIELNQKLGKILADKLLSAETFFLKKKQFFLIRLVHSSGENALPLRDDFRKKTFLLITDSQTFFLKTPNRGAITVKADYHDTGTALPVRLYRVKLIRCMKKNVSFF